MLKEVPDPWKMNGDWQIDSTDRNVLSPEWKSELLNWTHERKSRSQLRSTGAHVQKDDMHGFPIWNQKLSIKSHLTLWIAILSSF